MPRNISQLREGSLHLEIRGRPEELSDAAFNLFVEQNNLPKTLKAGLPPAVGACDRMELSTFWLRRYLGPPK